MNEEHLKRLVDFAEKHPHELVRVQSDEILEVALAAQAAIQPKLDTRAARPGLLTDRECCKLLGALIGGLTDIAPLDAIERAVRWWATHEDAWEALRHTLAPDRLVQSQEPSSS